MVSKAVILKVTYDCTYTDLTITHIVMQKTLLLNLEYITEIIFLKSKTYQTKI